MLLPNSVFFCLIISHLLLFSLGNTIPLNRNVHLADKPGLDGAPNADSSKVSSRDLEVQFGPEPGLDGAPKSDSPKISSRDLEVQFAPDPELNGAAKSDSSKVSSRDLEVLFGPEPGPNGAPKPDSPKVSSRDLEVQFGPDPELSGAAKSGSSKVSSRDLDVQFAADPALDGTPNPNGPPLSPRAPSGLDKLLQNDQRCAHRKNWHRSVDLKKRAKPSDVLWNVRPLRLHRRRDRGPSRRHRRSHPTEPGPVPEPDEPHPQPLSDPHPRANAASRFSHDAGVEQRGAGAGVAGSGPECADRSGGVGPGRTLPDGGERRRQGRDAGRSTHRWSDQGVA